MATTSTFHISIPSSMEQFVVRRVAENNYKSRGSYVQNLIQRDQLRAEKVKLANALLVGLASEREEMTPQKWRDFRNETLTKIAQKNK